jgi:hypothetical protein
MIPTLVKQCDAKDYHDLDILCLASEDSSNVRDMVIHKLDTIIYVRLTDTELFSESDGVTHEQRLMLWKIAANLAALDIMHPINHNLGMSKKQEGEENVPIITPPSVYMNVRFRGDPETIVQGRAGKKLNRQKLIIGVAVRICEKAVEAAKRTGIEGDMQLIESVAVVINFLASIILPHNKAGFFVLMKGELDKKGKEGRRERAVDVLVRLIDSICIENSPNHHPKTLAAVFNFLKSVMLAPLRWFQDDGKGNPPPMSESEYYTDLRSMTSKMAIKPSEELFSDAGGLTYLLRYLGGANYKSILAKINPMQDYADGEFSHVKCSTLIKWFAGKWRIIYIF